MNIFYCTDLVLEEMSAPSIHVYAICDQFARMGHAVTLYAPRLGKMRSNHGYTTVRIPTPRTLLSLFFQPQLALRLFMATFRSRPDILYVRHSHLMLAPMLAGTLLRIPIILEINGILEQDAVHINATLRSRIFLTTGMFRFLERLNAHAASLCIAVTDGIRDYFVEKYGVDEDRVVVIQNGVDTERFQPQSRDDARTRLGLDSHAFYVGYIGSLHEWQGIRYLIESARILGDEKNIRFLIIGGGEEREWIESRIAEYGLTNIELRRALPHDEIPNAINACDVCISYPKTFRDGATSPFKVYEYLACGKPVIASDLKSIRNEFGDVLIYTKPESAESLSTTILETASNPDKYHTYGESGRSSVEKGHSWRSVAHATLAYIDHVRRYG